MENNNTKCTEMSPSIYPLLRKIKIYRDRTSLEENQNSKKYYFPFRRRSKTASPSNYRRSNNKKSPKLRRLAANLHLPHYRKSAKISKVINYQKTGRRDRQVCLADFPTDHRVHQYTIR